MEPLKDFFNKDASVLNNKKLFLLDLDGTIYNENTLFEGVLEFLESILKRGGRYVFLTNNPSKNVEEYLKKVNKMGIKANKDNFFTSAQATGLLFLERFKDKKIYVQGPKCLITELKGFGLNITEEVEDDVKVVLLSFDTEITFEKLRKSCILLNREVEYYATNCDYVCPVNFGYVPDCGSICQMLYNATKRNPIYIGKPEPTMVNYVIEKFGYTKEETCLIGDRLYTDISAGFNAKITTICVLTGEAKIEDINNNKIKPNFVFNTISNIKFKF